MLDQIFNNVETYFLLLMRVSGIFTSTPFLGSESMPAQVRIASAFLLTIVLLPIQLAVAGPVALPGQTYIFVMVVVKEVLLGVLLGFIATVAIDGIRLAGELIGSQLGFGMISVADPESQQEESIMEIFNFMIFTLVFLAINGHHMIISAVSQSISVVPLGVVNYTKGFFEEIFSKVPEIFIISLKIAFPVVIPIIMVTLVLGIISKAVPRLEVFLISFPINIMIGFMVMMIYLPDLFRYLTYIIHADIIDEMTRIMHIIR